MVLFIKSWVWQGENSKKYQHGEKGEFSKEMEQWLIENKIATEIKTKKSENV
jgi:hypothetical protein